MNKLPYRDYLGVLSRNGSAPFQDRCSKCKAPLLRPTYVGPQVEFCLECAEEHEKEMRKKEEEKTKELDEILFEGAEG